MRSWRTGFDVPSEVAAGAPLVALAVFAVGVAPSGIGDIRVGMFPWTTGVAALCLAACCLGVLRVHRHQGGAWVLVGTWWTAAAMTAIATFFFVVGAGALLGIDERAVGMLSVLPVASMAFGLSSTAPAMLVLAVGITRGRVLARWGAAAMWVAAPILPAVMILGGLAEGTAERAGTTLLASVFGLAWIVLGASLVRSRTPSHSTTASHATRFTA